MVKGEKRLRKKRLLKAKEGLLKQAKEHRLKIETEKGNKDTTLEYWLKEIDNFEEQIKKIDEMLEKLE